MASRLALYVRRLYRIAAALALIVLALYGLQIWLHPFDAILAKLSDFAMNVDQRISQEAFKGITIGTLGLVLALCIFPIFLRRIDERAYARGLWRGLIAATVFYLSNRLFALASSMGRIHLIVAIAAVAIVTAIVVEGVSLSVREEDEKSFRTDVVASIASGLLFGVLVKLGQFGIEFVTKLIHPQSG